MPFVNSFIDREQAMIISLDDMVDIHSVARIIDCYVDSLNLAEMGFTNTIAAAEGRPTYHASYYLKLYLYGYRKNIRSSRKLQAACHENIDVMWLMNGLTPDFRSIADFRKDNISLLKDVYKEFTRRITENVELGFYSVDGSKFKAWNSKDRNFTIHKLDDRINWLENNINVYLNELNENDEIDEDKETDELLKKGILTREQLESKLSEAQARLDKYKGYRTTMEEKGLTQLSITDTDSRLMKNKNGMDVSYNVQTAVDSNTHLIMGFNVTNNVTDHGQLAPTLKEIKDDNEIIDSTADKGYEKEEDMVECLESGIIPNVIMPNPSNETYDLETIYEESSECDKTSSNKDELKKCLRSGIIPDAYKECIEDIEVVEVRRKVIDKEAQLKSPYGTEEEMINRAKEGFFVRNPETERVYCPAGCILRQKCIKKNGETRYANKPACKKCQYRLSPSANWNEIDFSKNKLERDAKWFKKAESVESESNDVYLRNKTEFHYEKRKIVRFKFRPDKQKMNERFSVSEHPFGTIKRALNAGYFLLKGLKKVAGEFALISLGYNLSRAENIFSFEELMLRVQG